MNKLLWAVTALALACGGQLDKDGNPEPDTSEIGTAREALTAPTRWTSGYGFLEHATYPSWGGNAIPCLGPWGTDYCNLPVSKTMSARWTGSSTCRVGGIGSSMPGELCSDAFNTACREVALETSQEFTGFVLTCPTSGTTTITGHECPSGTCSTKEWGHASLHETGGEFQTGASFRGVDPGGNGVYFNACDITFDEPTLDNGAVVGGTSPFYGRTQTEREWFAHNVLKHEIYHCLGLPHQKLGDNSVMRPTVGSTDNDFFAGNVWPHAYEFQGMQDWHPGSL